LLRLGLPPVVLVVATTTITSCSILIRDGKCFYRFAGTWFSWDLTFDSIHSSYEMDVNHQQ
jgi:hypothetical protein